MTLLTIFIIGLAVIIPCIFYICAKLDTLNHESGQQITFLELIYEEIRKLNNKK